MVTNDSRLPADNYQRVEYSLDVTISSGSTSMSKSAKDNATVFSDCDYHGNRYDTIVIDRLKGARLPSRCSRRGT